MNEIRETIPVNLEDNRYEIFVGQGLLSLVGEIVKKFRPGAGCAIITDENIASLHLKTLRKSMKSAEIQYTEIIVKPGEPSKSFITLQEVVNKLLSEKLERNDLILAFGGGVIGDLAGFAASITRRGIDFIQIPTSLLAQVDSSIGGKTGINTTHGKNLVGTFKQPVKVIIDVEVLRTLPKREFNAGYSEILKYSLIDNPVFFVWLEKNHGKIFNFENELVKAIAESCRSKAAIVVDDEFDQNDRRALLNLGHTFGHALEAACEYDNSRLVHGEGVAIGIMLAHEFSHWLGLCDKETVLRVRRHLQKSDLPVCISQIPGKLLPPEKVFDYILQDKKIIKGKLKFVLTRGLGQSYIANNISADETLAFMNSRFY